MVYFRKKVFKYSLVYNFLSHLCVLAYADWGINMYAVCEQITPVFEHQALHSAKYAMLLYFIIYRISKFSILSVEFSKLDETLPFNSAAVSNYKCDVENTVDQRCARIFFSREGVCQLRKNT